MKNKKFLKIAKLIISLSLTFSLFAGALSVFADTDMSRATVVKQSPYESPSGETPVGVGGPVGVRVNLLKSCTGVRFKIATYLKDDIEADISVYKWLGSHAKSIDAGAIYSDTILLVDNATQGIDFDNPLEPGDYLFLCHNFTSNVAMYSYSNVSGFKGYIYQQGFPVTNSNFYPYIQLLFSDRSNSFFGECSKPEDIIDGNHTPPKEYVIPEDSLIYTHPVMPDTWVFTDGLGRESLTHEDVGNPRKRYLAMFYWSWHIDSNASGTATNTNELSEKYPDFMRDYYHPIWKNYENAKFLWNESIYGFYRSDDKWVLRKQAELLANAGVDVIFTDNTNGQFTWANAYNPLMEAWSDAMADGVTTPKVSFMLPFGSKPDTNAQVRSIYLDVFRTGRYRELWFYWDSKPMLMGMGDSFDPNGSAVDKEISNFFTFRAGQPGYVVPETAYSNWGWLSMYPQAIYYKNEIEKNRGVVEQMPVGVAMNHNYELGLLAPMNGYNIAGRSYTSTYPNRYEVEGKEASKWGYNFAEQFNNALEIDPRVILVTGWNEYQAGRYQTWPEGHESAVENAFPDQFNNEFSRDIEPTKGALADHYYYQLVNFSRQYQGARPIPMPSKSATIDINGGIDQWQNIAPYYAAYIGNTDDRDAKGYGDLHYTESSGRNDIIGAQIARDGEYVYFLVECADNITPYTDSLWMNLYIDSDQDNQGWNTFEYVLNKSAASQNTLVLEKFTSDNSYNSEKIADVEYKLDGRYMTVKINKAHLGLEGDDFTINFAWTDNVHDEGNYGKFSGDIMDFYISGDVAPGGRFKYSYISTAENTGEHASSGSDKPEDTTDELTSEPATEEITEALTTEDTTEGAGIDESNTDSSENIGCGSSISVILPATSILAGLAVIKKRKKRKKSF